MFNHAIEKLRGFLRPRGKRTEKSSGVAHAPAAGSGSVTQARIGDSADSLVTVFLNLAAAGVDRVLPVELTGVNQRNSDGAERRNLAALCAPGELLQLVAVPENDFRESAVEVRRRTPVAGSESVTRDLVVGHLPDETARSITAELLDGAQWLAYAARKPGAVVLVHYALTRPSAATRAPSRGMRPDEMAWLKSYEAIFDSFQTSVLSHVWTEDPEERLRRRRAIADVTPGQFLELQPEEDGVAVLLGGKKIGMVRQTAARKILPEIQAGRIWVARFRDLAVPGASLDSPGILLVRQKVTSVT